MYYAKLSNSASELVNTKWKAFCDTHANHDFMDTRFLAAIEESMSNCAKIRYVRYFDEDSQLVSCCVFTIFKLDLWIPQSRFAKSFLLRIRKVFPMFFKVRLVLCGPPVSLGKNLIVSSRHADNIRLAHSIESTLDSLSKQYNAKIYLIQESANNQLGCLDQLLESGFCKWVSKPYYYFPTVFHSFDHYCSELIAKYRGNIKRAKKNFTSGGYSIKYINNADKIKEIFREKNLYRLYISVLNQSRHQFEMLSDTFFTNTAEKLPDNVLLTIAESEGEVSGFLFSYYSQKHFYLLFVGLDYKKNINNNIYYNLIYSTLEWSLNRKQFESIQLGQTADTFKARLGCTAEPLYFYFKAKTRRYQMLVDIIMSSEKVSGEIESYNVFKQYSMTQALSTKLSRAIAHEP